MIKPHSAQSIIELMDGKLPSPSAHHLPALKLYMQGEMHMDAGRVGEGVKCMRKAYALTWELESEEWPAEINTLHAELMNGTGPPLLANDSAVLPHDLRNLCVASPQQPASSRSTQQWWSEPDALTAIVSSLGTRHFAVIDGFAGQADASTLRAACLAASRDGKMQPARLAGTPGAQGRQDWIAWDPACFELLSRKTDALVAALRDAIPGLHRVACRQRPMVSTYGLHAAFVNNQAVVQTLWPGRTDQPLPNMRTELPTAAAMARPTFAPVCRPATSITTLALQKRMGGKRVEAPQNLPTSFALVCMRSL